MKGVLMQICSVCADAPITVDISTGGSWHSVEFQVNKADVMTVRLIPDHGQPTIDMAHLLTRVSLALLEAERERTPVKPVVKLNDRQLHDIEVAIEHRISDPVFYRILKERIVAIVEEPSSHSLDAKIEALRQAVGE